MKTYHEGAVQNYLSEEARRKLSDAIRQAGGAEVFAVGRCDRDYIVIDVDVLSVGHMSAAPVVSAALMRGQVVLHNHPSGQLMPSDADLAVASALAQKGIGFWIVDNAVQRIRPVTDPMTNASGSIVIAPADIEHLFSDHGLLAKGYPDYEPRPGQLLMALKVTEALSTVSHLVVEAGTGTGKSLAYLAPIVLWAQRNEARVVVSTNTINLQEQLIASDIPALAKALGEPVRACLVKGRANYLCLRKLDTALAEDYLSDELAPIVSWAQTTVTGDRSTMPFEPSPEAWELVCAEPDLCLGQRCSYYAQCFFFAARRNMESAQVLVTNHHLLFADAAIRQQMGQRAAKGVLPKYRAVVLDEAHNAADVATEYFGMQASRLGAVRLLNQVFRKESRPAAREQGSEQADSGGGALARARAYIFRHWGDREREASLRAAVEILDMEAIPAAIRCRDSCENFFSELRTLMLSRPASEEAGEWTDAASRNEREVRIDRKLTENDAWNRRVYPAHEGFAAALEDLAESISRLAKALRGRGDDDAGCTEADGLGHAADGSGDADGADPSGAALLMELRAYSARAVALAEAVRFAVKADSPDFVYWVEVSGRGRRSNVRLIAAPIEPGPEIVQSLLPGVDTAVFTSATLAVGNSFEYSAHSLGLDTLEPDCVQYVVAPSPFDFASQALLLCADDMPVPDSPGWEPRLLEALASLLDASGGRAFVLFTSYKLLKSMASQIEPYMRQHGMRLLVQGDKPRKALLDEFRSDIGSVLFGTDSFWEGVDVPGQALSCVIIPRLPFAVPTAPLLQARVDSVRARGGDPFRELALPAAVLKFKQGFGRLIRTSTDRGAVAVLDPRIVTRRYGRHFIRSLPDCSKAVGPVSELAAALRDWLCAGT
ncbi:MAG: helicase C-terminal domain-containing protein [Bacillota bacterium]|jgi:ATP-dependent DNA helicase DinG